MSEPTSLQAVNRFTFLDSDIDLLIPSVNQRQQLKEFLRDIDVCQRRIFIFCGPSESGKSYLLERVREVLGPRMDVAHLSSAPGGGIVQGQASLSLLALEAGRGAWTTINDIEPNMPIWTPLPNHDMELRVLRGFAQGQRALVLVDTDPASHWTVNVPTANVVYVTQELPSAEILALGTLIQLPWHVPSLLRAIRERIREDLNPRLLPELIHLVLGYYG